MRNKTFTRQLVATTLAALSLLTPVAARAQQCDPDTEARLQFLETRLDEGAHNTRLWWGGWMAVFSIGVVYGVTAGALEDNNEIAVANYITASKGALGIAQLVLRPNVGRHGAAPMRAIPKTSSASCAERLKLAEKSMEMAAGDANMRWSWQRHLGSLLLNLGAGLAVAEGCDEPEQGWRDFGISEVSSELHLWTHPTRASDDWQQYRSQFSGAPVAAEPSTFRFAAQRGGVGFIWKF